MTVEIYIICHILIIIHLNPIKKILEKTPINDHFSSFYSENAQICDQFSDMGYILDWVSTPLLQVTLISCSPMKKDRTENIQKIYKKCAIRKLYRNCTENI